MEKIRLQKALAMAGVASRRASEKLIEQARVEVNDQIIAEQGFRVCLDTDVIKVDGARISFDKNKIVLVLNKPIGVESTMSIETNNTSLADLIPVKYKGIFPIGRLDKNTTGLLLFTNDGELTYRLSHPKYKVSKKYICLIAGQIGNNKIKQLLQGVSLEDGLSRFDKVKIIGSNGDKTILEIILHSGKNRIIRRTLKALGFEILELSRIAFGSIMLGELKLGKMRVLSATEVGSLAKLVQL
ncbi:MAG: rRNA pseudouridine synthase [Bifidobacteriaceae bacterium]|jgi:23S rRNA pseudouridine2605 synthase|nr:rRNA pseudouridine synthase [Bifidobacteriaceae bacterium]